MGLIKIPSARPFSEAAVAGRDQGRPPSNFDRDKAADARIAASRWQSQNRARNLGGNSEKPWTSMTNREEAARRASVAAGEFQNSRFSQVEGAADESRRFKSFRPRPPGTGQETSATSNTDEQEFAPS
jgi:hypothetical protein